VPTAEWSTIDEDIGELEKQLNKTILAKILGLKKVVLLIIICLKDYLENDLVIVAIRATHSQHLWR
jgi:hypothetical protein